MTKITGRAYEAKIQPAEAKIRHLYTEPTPTCPII